MKWSCLLAVLRDDWETGISRKEETEKCSRQPSQLQERDNWWQTWLWVAEWITCHWSCAEPVTAAFLKCWRQHRHSLYQFTTPAHFAHWNIQTGEKIFAHLMFVFAAFILTLFLLSIWVRLKAAKVRGQSQYCNEITYRERMYRGSPIL